VITPGADAPAYALSGGNQQKLIVGREMMAGPKLLIAAQPTRGIDVGAQAAVWEEIRGARANGLGVLLISADLEELIGLSDTLYVIFRGEFVARLDPGKVSTEELGSYMTGAREKAVEA
jgi:general nucleoside transport system ATP-binding protein